MYRESNFILSMSIRIHVQQRHPDHDFPSLPLMFLPKREATGQNEIALRAIIPLYMVLAFTQVIPPMLNVIVDEKEKKIKESMKMVGLRDSGTLLFGGVASRGS